MRLIDAESLKELFPDNGEGSWTYNATAKAYIDAQPTVEAPDINVGNMDTTTRDSIPDETGKNDADKTSGDCTSRTQAINALRNYLVGKRCPDDGTLTCRLIENEVINKLPSTQPERKTGRWIEDAETYYKAVNEKGGGVNENTPYFTDCIACSECLSMFSVIDNETERFDFCPNCGAKMEGEKKE